MRLNVETITALTKLLFDGFATIIIIILYVLGNKKRDDEYKNERQKYEKINEELQENYNSIIKGIISGISQKHLTPNESKSIAKIERQINSVINVILKESNASRVCVIRYHNGNKDMLGKSFLKMSMTNEVVNLGVASMMADFKDVFRSLLAYWCHEIETKGECVIPDVEKVKDSDITLYQYLKVRNIEGQYGIALRDCENNVIGFMCVEFLSQSDFDLQKIQDTIKKYFPKIEALISIDGGVKDELQ